MGAHFNVEVMGHYIPAVKLSTPVILQVRSHCPRVTGSHERKNKKGGGRGDHSFIHSLVNTAQRQILATGETLSSHSSLNRMGAQCFKHSSLSLRPSRLE